MNPGEVPRNGTIALDAVALVYFIEQHPTYLALSERVFEGIATGGARGIASTLIFSELLVPYFRSGGSAEARAVVDAVRNVPNLVCVEPTATIIFAAARLRALYNLRTPDAVHVATALEHNADWFVTNDRHLRRVEAEGIRIWLFNEHL